MQIVTTGHMTMLVRELTTLSLLTLRSTLGAEQTPLYTRYYFVKTGLGGVDREVDGIHFHSSPRLGLAIQ